MTKSQADIAEKRRILRAEYGGLMSLKNLTHELGLRDTRAAKRWAAEHGLRYVLMLKQGGKAAPRFDTDALAKILVSEMRPAQTLR